MQFRFLGSLGKVISLPRDQILDAGLPYLGVVKLSQLHIPYSHPQAREVVDSTSHSKSGCQMYAFKLLE